MPLNEILVNQNIVRIKNVWIQNPDVFYDDYKNNLIKTALTG